MNGHLRSAKTTLDAGASIAFILVSAVVVWNQTARNPQATSPSGAKQMSPIRMGLNSVSKRLGHGSVVLLEFADFQCPYCAQDASETYPRLKTELIDSGRISYVYLHFPLRNIHPNAFSASEAAECSGRQNKYWEMHTTLFAHQRDLAPASLLDYGRSLSLDMQAFTKCLGGEVADTINGDIRQGERLGVTGTPAFFLGRIDADGSAVLTKRLDGMASFENLREEINGLVAGPRSWWVWLR